MNVNGFRRWLKSQIALLDDDTDSAVDRADETVSVIRELETAEDASSRQIRD